VAASNTLQLRRDGTFGGDAVTTMSSTSSKSVVSGGGTSSTAGTYEFDGYSLTLKHADGHVEKRSVFAFSDRDAQGAPEYIWREGTMMQRIDAKK
jgi:hypothetical protein